MRTTVTIDPDVASLLSAFMKRQGLSFKEALNSALRRGLVGATSKDRPARLQLPAFPMQLRPGLDLDKALQLASDLEDEELLRRMQIGK